MQHKCGGHDRGSGKGAVAYLTGLKDAKGKLRAGIEVLRGDPGLTARLIDSLKTSCKYTSSVIAWHKDDDPTPEEIQDVLDDWERVAFAGLRKSQYTFCAVLHTDDDGSKHIHIITPRVCLESGRSLNIAPPGHEYYFAKWRNVWNHEKGWARPDDPTRARLVQPGKKSYSQADELRSKLDKSSTKDSREQITDWLMKRIETGELVNRTDILSALSEVFVINRAGADYVSVRLGDAKPIRLKGLLYGDSFSPELINGIAAKQASRPRGRAEPDLGAAAAARKELELAIENRTKYNQERYSKPARSISNRSERCDDFGREALQGVDQLCNHLEFGPGASIDQVDGGTEFSSRQQEVKDRSVAVPPRPATGLIEHSDNKPNALADALASDINSSALHDSVSGNTVMELGNSRNEPSRNRQEADVSGEKSSSYTVSNQRVKPGVLQQSSRQSELQEPKTELEINDDRTRNAVNEFFAAVDRLTHAAGAAVERCIAAASRAVRGASTSVVEAGSAVDRHSTATARANTSVGQSIDYVNKNSNGVKKYMDDELDRFKYCISIKDFAVNELGYEFIRSESTRVYFVLRKGDEKIIITGSAKADGPGYDLYINNKDKSDSGSIVDFVKNRVGDNNAKLVKVRQELRPWCPGAKKPAIKKPLDPPSHPVGVSKDRTAVVTAWTAMKPYSGTYLTDVRKLDPAVIKAFDVRQDEYGTACFKHRKPGEGVVGYEYRKPSDQSLVPNGFCAGGEKSLFMDRLDGVMPVSRLVVVEAAIDALSYAQMYHKLGTIYMSTAGSPISKAQAELLQSIITGNPNATLVLATDNDLTDKHGQPLAFDDRPGEKLAKEIAAMAPVGMAVERHTPEAKDWNKDLQNMVEAEAKRVSSKNYTRNI